MSEIQNARALSLLENPESYPLLPQRNFIRLFRVWVYPTFAPYVAWSLAQASEQFYIRRVVWDQVHTVDLEPITFGTELPVLEETFHKLLAELRAMQLTPFTLASATGVDGTSYGVEVGTFNPSGRLSWWGNPPEAWSPLQAWHTCATQLFESLLPLSTPDLRRLGASS